MGGSSRAVKRGKKAARKAVKPVATVARETKKVAKKAVRETKKVGNEVARETKKVGKTVTGYIGAAVPATVAIMSKNASDGAGEAGALSLRDDSKKKRTKKVSHGKVGEKKIVKTIQKTGIKT